MTSTRGRRQWTLGTIAAIAALARPSPAWAHSGRAPSAGPWWTAWDCDPLLLLLLALTWAVYARGTLALWERSGVGRGVTRGQVAAFAGGIGTLVLALASPLDAVSGELSSAHMTQHMLLMMIAAPLLALGSPLAVGLAPLPEGWRRAWLPALRWVEARVNPTRGLGPALFAWGLFAAVLWAWHVPRPYETALRNPWVHDLQHLSFLLSSCLFWRIILDPVNRLRLNRGAGVLYLFTTCLHASALGVYMTLSPRVWYLDYSSTTPLWHMSPLEDQQLAGLIMWMPGCLLYALAATALFAAWLLETDRRERRCEPEVVVSPALAPTGETVPRAAVEKAGTHA